MHLKAHCLPFSTVPRRTSENSVSSSFAPRTLAHGHSSSFSSNGPVESMSDKAMPGSVHKTEDFEYLPEDKDKVGPVTLFDKQSQV